MVDTEDAVRAGGERSALTPALTLSPPKLLDGLWLLLLAIYVLAGMPLTPFHGDESMHVYSSHDYATLFIQRQPERLLTNPPYPVDSDQHLRILNGSINRYAIGLTWHLAGMTEDDLPRLWSWPESYRANVAAGRRPNDALLAAARLPSAILLVVSIGVTFALGWQFGKRRLAYLASGLYALNPIILLNGRRAMQEGAFLCFGLLALLCAANIVRRGQEQGRWRPWWAGLSIASGLALASKHNAAMFVAAAFGGLLAAELVARRWHALLPTVLRLAISGLAALGLFLALSPALWNNPIARLGALVATRQELLAGQIHAGSDVLLTPTQRLADIITQPFLTPPQYYEARFWADADPITSEITRYEASHLDGVRFGALLGIPLTILACLGLGATLWPRVRPYPSGELTIGLLVWLAVMIAAALANPLPWQRYYLQLVPLASLLAGVGMVSLARLVLDYAHKLLSAMPQGDGL